MTSQRPPDARITGGFVRILENSGLDAKCLLSTHNSREEPSASIDRNYPMSGPRYDDLTVEAAQSPGSAQLAS